MEENKKAKEYDSTLKSVEPQQKSLESKQKTFNILMKNLMKDDFKGTRRSIYIMLLLPTSINCYFLFVSRGRYLKNMLSLGSFFGGMTYFNFRMRNEVDLFVQKDQTVKNIVRDEINMMHAASISAPDYTNEAHQVIGKLILLTLLDSRNRSPVRE